MRGSCGVLSNPRMQLTGRPVPSSARALSADGDQWNVSWCGRGHDGPQLMRKSSGRSGTKRGMLDGGPRAMPR